MPYTEEDWEEERNRITAREIASPCPTCGRSGFYGPRGPTDDGRKYRMCKFCGFYQEVEEEPVVLRACVHGCEDWPAIMGAPYIQWVLPAKKSYQCFYCEEEVPVDSTVVERPVEDEDHPWYEVQQGLTYGEYGQLWGSYVERPGGHL